MKSISLTLLIFFFQMHILAQEKKRIQLSPKNVHILGDFSFNVDLTTENLTSDFKLINSNIRCRNNGIIPDNKLNINKGSLPNSLIISLLNISDFEINENESFLIFEKAQNGNTNNTIEQPKEITTKSGLKVQFQSQNGKEKPSAGDKVTVHYTGYLYKNGQKGKKFDSSKDRGTPFSFQLGVGQVIPGWDEGIALLGKGDKATLIIPSELGYGARGAGDAIPPNATLCFDVELIYFKATPKATPFNVEGKKVQKTASGLEYIVLESGNGAKAEAGKTVSVHYSGYLFENGKCGKKFDSSVERGEPIDFPLGKGYVIKGWDEGIGLMKVGDKMRLIIPSYLGYGSAGAGGVIPANATLIFDVELVNVK